jgi:gag-polypeptide of LTR copia-type/GAG-pre-integrase domain
VQPVSTASLRPPRPIHHYNVLFLENNGSNYMSWKFHVKTTLDLHEIWSMVNSTFSKPDPAVNPDSAENWRWKNKEAFAQITMMLKDKPLNSIIESKSAKEAWDKLHVWYEGSRKQHIIHLLNNIFCTIFNKSKPMEPQINTICQATHTITNLGLSLDEELIMFAIIMALPPSLTTLKTILSNSTSELTPNYIKSQIMHDEQCCIHEYSEGQSAFFTKAGKKGKGKGKGKDTSQEDKQKKKCLHCKHIGHLVKECCKKKEEEEEKATSNTSKPAAPTTSTPATTSVKITKATEPLPDKTAMCSARVYHAMTKLSESNSTQSKQIIDSGASCTMCLNWSWFMHFTELTKATTVYLGNNSTILGTGVSSIHTHMKANGEWSDTILHNVLHIPNLHSNPLSVNHLTSHSTNVLFNGGNCFIHDGEDIVCKGQRANNLYIMDMTTSAPISAHITTIEVFPDKDDDVPPPDVTMLATCPSMSKADINTWHRRLSHLNINAVLCMSRKGMVKGMEIIGKAKSTEPYEPCLIGKQAHTEISKLTETHSDEVLGQVHSDICSKLLTRLHKGFEYFIT